jgi:hypothetical protein
LGETAGWEEAVTAALLLLLLVALTLWLYCWSCKAVVMFCGFDTGLGFAMVFKISWCAHYT